MRKSEKILEFLEKLAKNAEKIIKEHPNYSVFEKGVRDVVTELDVEVEKYCIAEIKANYPEVAIVSEELNSDKQIEKCCFLIDPIDGTKNFAHGLPICGIQLAYMEKGKVLASVINLFELGFLISATRERGVTCNGSPIQKDTNIDFEHSLWLVEGTGEKWKVAYKLNENVRGVRSFGCTSMTYGMLAVKGVSGAVISFDVTKKPWDIVPGIFICECAGIKTLRLPNGWQVLGVNDQILKEAVRILLDEEVSSKN